MTQDLKAKFSALREFVKTIPAEKLDMKVISGEHNEGCGCVYFHAPSETIYRPLEEAVAWDDLDDLFSITANTYGVNHKDQPAKDEFLRRLDTLEAKYCGEES